jgi:hypothetical protein
VVEDFFTLSKDADTNVPISTAAKNSARKVGIIRGNFKTLQLKRSEAIRSHKNKLGIGSLRLIDRFVSKR